MKRGILILSPILLAGMILLTSCKEDDMNDELRAQERRLLEQYLINNDITQDPTSSGLYYIQIVEGTGASPDDGDWIEIEYTGKLVDGSLFGSTSDSIAKLHSTFDPAQLYGPLRTFMSPALLTGLHEGIKYMKAGGSARFIIPSELGFGASSSDLIPAFSTQIYTIDLLSVFSDPPSHERELIQYFLADSNFTADSTASGLYYIEQVEGTGDYISEGDSLYIWYTGFFLDGRVFDSNIDKAIFKMSVPGTQLIEGWNEGLRLMRKGSKGILIVPYYLGYGESGYWDSVGRTQIPPYMTLVFEIEIEQVI